MQHHPSDFIPIYFLYSTTALAYSPFMFHPPINQRVILFLTLKSCTYTLPSLSKIWLSSMDYYSRALLKFVPLPIRYLMFLLLLSSCCGNSTS